MLGYKSAYHHTSQQVLLNVPLQVQYNVPQQGFLNAPLLQGYPNVPQLQGYQNAPQLQDYPNVPLLQGYQNAPQQQSYPNATQGFQNAPQLQGYPNIPILQGYQNAPQQQGYPNAPQGFQNAPLMQGYQNAAQLQGYQNATQQGYQNASQQGLLHHIENLQGLQHDAWLLSDPKHPQIYSIVQNPSNRVKTFLIMTLVGVIMILISFLAINPTSLYRQKGGKMLSGASIQPYLWYDCSIWIIGGVFIVFPLLGLVFSRREITKFDFELRKITHCSERHFVLGCVRTRDNVLSEEHETVAFSEVRSCHIVVVHGSKNHVTRTITINEDFPVHFDPSAYTEGCDVEHLKKQLIDWMIRSAVVGPEVFSDHSTPVGMPGSQLAAVSMPHVVGADQLTPYNRNGNPPSYAVDD